MDSNVSGNTTFVIVVLFLNTGAVPPMSPLTVTPLTVLGITTSLSFPVYFVINPVESFIVKSPSVRAAAKDAPGEKIPKIKKTAAQTAKRVLRFICKIRMFIPPYKLILSQCDVVVPETHNLSLQSFVNFFLYLCYLRHFLSSYYVIPFTSLPSAIDVCRLNRITMSSRPQGGHRKQSPSLSKGIASFHNRRGRAPYIKTRSARAICNCSAITRQGVASSGITPAACFEKFVFVMSCEKSEKAKRKM
jgi:hypothetical protein